MATPEWSSARRPLRLSSCTSAVAGATSTSARPRTWTSWRSRCPRPCLHHALVPLGRRARERPIVQPQSTEALEVQGFLVGAAGFEPATSTV